MRAPLPLSSYIALQPCKFFHFNHESPKIGPPLTRTHFARACRVDSEPLRDFNKAKSPLLSGPGRIFLVALPGIEPGF